MDFRDLQYVLAIAKHLNNTKAADTLYVTQPTLSKFLKGLEDDLGLRLFQKLGHTYMLTYAGERYVAKAEQILQLKKDLDLELADILKRNVGVLKVALPTMRCTYILPCILPAFQKIHPHIRVEISEGHSNELDSKILAGEVEMAFYTQPVGTPNPLLEYEIIREEELLICTAKDNHIGQFAQPNPASPYPSLDVSLLKNEQFILMQSTQRTRQVVDEYLQRRNITLENVFCTSNMTAIMELVAAGYGTAFVFEPHLRHRTAGPPIDCYSFGEPTTKANFVAAYRKGAYLPAYARDFIHLIQSLDEEC